MLIKKCVGEGLEKTSPTSPEDSFNRSTVTFEWNGRERSFEVVYLQYFERRLPEVNSLRGIVALAALLQHPEYRERKRLYIHDEETFVALFDDVDFAKMDEVAKEIESGVTCELESLRGRVHIGEKA